MSALTAKCKNYFSPAHSVVIYAMGMGLKVLQQNVAHK